MKKKDDELSMLILVNGIFTVVLLLLDIFAAKWGIMSFFLIAVIAIGHAASALFWWLSVTNYKDPNKDWMRKVTLLFIVVTSAIILLHRTGYIENKQFEEDVEKAKQEQAK